MKASVCSIVAAAALAFAGPIAIQQRDVATTATTIDTLTSQVMVITAQISTSGQPELALGVPC